MTTSSSPNPSPDFTTSSSQCSCPSTPHQYFKLNRFTKLQHDWKYARLVNSRDLVFNNTVADIEYILVSCSANGTRFEFECYDISHLYNLSHFVERKLAQPPFFIQIVFGLPGGIGSHPEDLMQMRRTADHLFGNDYLRSILGAGHQQIPLATAGLMQGSNLRVGPEDSF